jgi:hydroxymethylbilane synthase
VPIGAHARVENDQLRVLAVVVSPDGSRIVRRQAIGPLAEALKLGEALAQELLAAGAQEILEAVYGI